MIDGKTDLLLISKRVQEEKNDAKEHCDWCDVKFFGVCHFGAVPLT